MKIYTSKRPVYDYIYLWYYEAEDMVTLINLELPTEKQGPYVLPLNWEFIVAPGCEAPRRGWELPGSYVLYGRY